VLWCNSLTRKGLLGLILGFPKRRAAARTPVRSCAGRPTCRIDHETHVSSLQDPPRTDARLPRSHEDSRGPGRYQRASRQGPQAPVGLSRRSEAPLKVCSVGGSHSRLPCTASPVPRSGASRRSEAPLKVCSVGGPSRADAAQLRWCPGPARTRAARLGERPVSAP